MGHLALPRSEALPPHIPLQEQNWQKSAIFGFLYFFPSPHPNKKQSGAATGKRTMYIGKFKGLSSGL